MPLFLSLLNFSPPAIHHLIPPFIINLKYGNANGLSFPFVALPFLNMTAQCILKRQIDGTCDQKPFGSSQKNKLLSLSFTCQHITSNTACYLLVLLHNHLMHGGCWGQLPTSFRKLASLIRIGKSGNFSHKDGKSTFIQFS